MAIIIKISGEIINNIEPKNGKTFSLEELQKAVNGYIQIISISKGKYAGKLMVVDEEGLLKPNPQLNEKASQIAGQPIVGQVIIIDKNHIE